VDYSSFKTSLAGLMVYDETDADFTAMLPDAIASAELRLYRDLNLIDTTQRDTSLNCTPSSRYVDMSSLAQRMVVLEAVNIITPSGVASPETGLRNPLVRSSLELIDFTYGSSTTAAVPQVYALIDSQTIVLGPWPDQVYPVEVVGTFRPAALSSTNTTTLLTRYFEDLFLIAAMIYAAGWMRNYGQGSDDPQMAQSWLAQYQDKIKSAGIEEARKRALGGGA
jgi:hypothetical protein